MFASYTVLTYEIIKLSFNLEFLEIIAQYSIGIKFHYDNWTAYIFLNMFSCIFQVFMHISSFILDIKAYLYHKLSIITTTFGLWRLVLTFHHRSNVFFLLNIWCYINLEYLTNWFINILFFKKKWSLHPVSSFQLSVCFPGKKSLTPNLSQCVFHLSISQSVD